MQAPGRYLLSVNGSFLPPALLLPVPQGGAVEPAPRSPGCRSGYAATVPGFPPATRTADTGPSRGQGLLLHDSCALQEPPTTTIPVPTLSHPSIFPGLLPLLNPLPSAPFLSPLAADSGSPFSLYPGCPAPYTSLLPLPLIWGSGHCLKVTLWVP